MALKTYKPKTPSLRQLVLVDRAGLWKGKPVKALTEGKRKTGGRNNKGRITTRHQGGGHKRRYRIIDFKRRKDGVPAKVAAIEYDPNRSAYIALLHYADGEKSYILAPNRLRVGMTVQSGAGSDITVGNAMSLSLMPVGTLVHNVELQPGRGGQLVEELLRLFLVLLRDVDPELLAEEGRDHHEDDQQHQHHVHHGSDVDVGIDLLSFIAFRYCHGPTSPAS